MSVMRCAICRRSFESDASPALPFCSARCKQIDLGRWLGEQYGLPWQREEGSDGPDANGENDSQDNGRGEYYSD